MADIFVSYARPDEPQAKRVADALRDAGFSVWRDDQLPAHRAYAEVIQERLTSSKAVIVLWSADAATSQWVRAEADVGRHARTLVQATLDDTIPPLPFNQIQCASLADWKGDGSAPGWRKLLESVAELTGTQPVADEPKAQSRKHGICILPFANMSGDPEQEYFSDGISEDITTDLSKVSALDVIARNTAFTFKGRSLDVCEVARRLGVGHVLEGSVRKAGSRVRISAQLIDGKTGSHVWAERYDRELTDIFAIQDEISKAIVDALKLTLLPGERAAIEHHGTASSEAYNLYLMARQHWITGNHGDRRREERVVRLCKRATEVDPSYADAWALLSIAQSNLHFGFGDAGDDGVAAADRALTLNPSVVEAYCAKARFLAESGRIDEAIAQIKEALRLKPDSWELNKQAGRLFILRGEIADAVPCFERAVEVLKSDYHGWGMLVTCYRGLGDHEGMRRAASASLGEVERAVEQDPSNGNAISWGVSALAVLGQKERAREWIERGLLLDPDNVNMRYNFACTLAADLNEPDAALDMLEAGFRRLVGSITLAETDPDFDSIRDNPRFTEIVAKAKARVAKTRQQWVKSAS